MDSERCVCDAFRYECTFVGIADPSHAEVGGGEDDGRHVLQMSITQQPNVLEVVCLLDVADCLLDSPPGDYKVSSVSRHYVAGNSEPIVSESPATEAVRASLGKVKFFWNDVAVKQGERAEVLLSIENSLSYDVAGKTQVVTYDPAYLTPLKIFVCQRRPPSTDCA